MIDNMNIEVDNEIALFTTKTDFNGMSTRIIASPVRAGKVPAQVNQYQDSVTGAQGKPFSVIGGMGYPANNSPSLS